MSVLLLVYWLPPTSLGHRKSHFFEIVRQFLVLDATCFCLEYFHSCTKVNVIGYVGAGFSLNGDSHLYGDGKEINDILSLMEDDDYEIPEVQEPEARPERRVPRKREEPEKEEPLKEEDIEIIDPFKED